MPHPALYIADIAGRGRGILTEDPLPAGTLVEEAPVIRMTAAERVLLDQTALHDYIFEWEDGCAMALGWVPLFNHAVPSNCEYVMDYEAATMRVETVRDIRAGEELTINYNGDFDDAKPVWFAVGQL